MVQHGSEHMSSTYAHARAQGADRDDPTKPCKPCKSGAGQRYRLGRGFNLRAW